MTLEFLDKVKNLIEQTDGEEWSDMDAEKVLKQ
jgi:hypothetical protein